MIPSILTRWLWQRRANRIAKAWAQWYAAHPCKQSYSEPWLSATERKHAKYVL